MIEERRNDMPHKSDRARRTLDKAAELQDMPGFLFRVLEAKANSLFQAALAGQNLTTRQFGVLISLLRHGDMTQTELADRISSDKNSLSEMIVRMTERGLITRTQGLDRRSVMIGLTDQGLALVTDVAPHVVAVQERILDALPEEYRLIFMKCLKLLAEHDFIGERTFSAAE